MFSDADLDRLEPIQAPGTTAEKLVKTCRRLQRERDATRRRVDELEQQAVQSAITIYELDARCAGLELQLSDLQAALAAVPTQPAPSPVQRRWYEWRR